MSEPNRITDPSYLADLATRLSTLAISPSPQPTTLVLLQPLANPSLLALCRNPSSGIVRMQDGTPSSSISKIEILNIQPLSQAWRQALSKILPLTDLVFDLSLPVPLETLRSSESDEASDFQKVYWETATPREGGLTVLTRNVMLLAVSIATVIRMRADGVVKFRVLYDEREGLTRKAMAGLEKQLSGLEKEYKKTSGKVEQE